MKYIHTKLITSIFLISLLCIIIFYTFNNNNSIINTNADKVVNICNIKYTSTKNFKLDNETNNLSSYIQFIDNDSICYLSFVNEYNNSIYFYNFENSEFCKTIKYNKEGNNGVGKIQGYYYINEDSILVYGYRGHRLFLTDSSSSVVSSSKLLFQKTKYENVEEITSFPPSPYVQTDNPIRIIGDNVILGGYIGGEYILENSKNRPVNIIYNLAKKEIKYLNNYPEIYQKYNWGGGMAYRLPHFDVNKNNIVLSFSADHYIENYSFQRDSITKHYAGSSFIKEINSFSYPKSIPINKERVMNWYRENPSYEGVYYDKYKDLYYRIARLPNKDYIKNKIGNGKPIVIIVLDSKLNYLGEGKLPTNLNLRPTNCFVTKDGFYIQLLNEDEDYFTFCKFEIEIKK